MSERFNGNVLSSPEFSSDADRESQYEDLIFLVGNRFNTALERNAAEDGYLYILHDDFDVQSDFGDDTTQRLAKFALGKSLEASLLESDPVVEITIPVFMDQDLPSMGIVGGFVLDLKSAQFLVRNKQQNWKPFKVTYDNFDKKLKRKISKTSSDDELGVPLQTYMDFIRYGDVLPVRQIK